MLVAKVAIVVAYLVFAVVAHAWVRLGLTFWKNTGSVDPMKTHGQPAPGYYTLEETNEKLAKAFGRSDVSRTLEYTQTANGYFQADAARRIVEESAVLSVAAGVDPDEELTCIEVDLSELRAKAAEEVG